MQAALVLFAVSAAVGWLFLRLVPFFSRGVIALVMLIPAVSALSIMVLGITVDGILPDRRIRFPANLTLPILHAAIMAVVVQLLVTTANPLEATPEQAIPALLLWFNPFTLSVCVVFSVGFLSLFLIRSPKK